MELQKETTKLIARLVKKWDKTKQKHFPFKPETYGAQNYTTVIGSIWWNNPDLIWIYLTNNEEGYEGSQEQLGISKEGKIYWQYQSHCSCNDYEDTTDLGEQFTENSLKSFELRDLPKEWEFIIQGNIKLLLK